MPNDSKPRGLLPREIFKLLAMLFMLIDHMGAAFYPYLIWMRCVGRLAFPMFAFSIAQGFEHTHSKIRYLFTMLLFAFLSEVPYDLLWARNPFSFQQQNVLFTFTLSLLLLMLIDRLRRSRLPLFVKWLLSVGAIAALSAAAEFTNLDYGAAGVLMVLLFYLAIQIPQKVLQYLFEAVFLFVLDWYLIPSFDLMLSSGMMVPVQGFAIFSLPLIWLYNGRKTLSGKAGKVYQYFCYAFYPVHLLLLWWIALWIG